MKRTIYNVQSSLCKSILKSVWVKVTSMVGYPYIPLFAYVAVNTNSSHSHPVLGMHA